MTEESALEPAFVHVVRGEPDDVELAALVAGLAAAGGTGAEEPAAPRHSAWTDRARAMRTRIGPRTPITPGADTWRWSLHS